MFGYDVFHGSAAYPLLFLMIDSSDHLTGKTGLTPTVTLRKNGGSAAAPAGAVSELGDGWYQVAGNATDTATLGPLVLHATATGADPSDAMYPVIAKDPQAAFVQTDMEQAYPTNPTPETVGEAYQAARAYGFGSWSVSGTTLTIKDAAGTTIKTFTIAVDGSGNPTGRTAS